NVVTERRPLSDEGTRPADESSHVRDDLSQLRHELRTPLNQIIGYSELLEEEAAQAGLGEFVADLQKIHRAAHDLLATINRALARDTPASGQLQNRDAGDGTRPASKPVARLDGRVLIVDDNALNRDMLARRLEHHGCTVAVADSGLHALESLESQRF